MGIEPPVVHVEQARAEATHHDPREQLHLAAERRVRVLRLRPVAGQRGTQLLGIVHGTLRDVAEEAEVVAFFDRAVERLGTPRVFVNNAGMSPLYESPATVSRELFDKVIGVNLDTDEAAIDAFLEKSGMGWRTVFHTAPDRRGWNHPVAVHYGVRTIPELWLVDAEGKTVTTSITAETLDATLEKQLSTTVKVSATKAAQPTE